MSSFDKERLRAAREAGLVSIMVTLILMIVISLIVLGFAQISRRNQRQALDRQLSTQAFYAAETGVNDTRELIDAALAAGDSVPAKTDCAAGSGATAAFYASLTPDLDSGSDVKYSCIMVDPTPTALLYSGIGTEATIVPLISASGSNISTITLTWQSKDATTTPINNCPNTTTAIFTATSGWLCGYGVLRVDLVPTNGSLDAATLQSRNMATFFLPFRPGSSGGVNTIPHLPNGVNKIGVNCTNANCTLQYTGLNTNQYYMRVSSVYKNVSLRVTAADSSGAALELQGAQAVIDSTGRASDVLRRIQVHTPLNGSSTNKMSDYALRTTDSMCKRFVVMDGYFDTSVNGVTSGNPLCQP